MNLTFLTCCLLLQSFTPETIEHAQTGAAALKDGRLDVAVREFRKVTELQPDSASGHANLGEAYFRQGDYSAAIAEFHRALALNSNLMGTHQTLGVALLVQGNAEGAIPHLEKMRSPELLGLAYLETGRLGTAIMALQAAVERQPADPDLLYYFGRATFLASKQTAERAARLSHVPAGNSNDAAKGDARLPQGIAALQQALAQHPDDPNLLLAFSRTASLASKRAFDQVVQSQANSPRAHQILAERFLDGGRLAEAEREYAESLRLNPYAPGVHFALGNVLAAEGNPARAAEQFRMESKLRPLSADALYSLGSLLLQQGQAAAAIEELAHADRLRPDTPQILLALGSAAMAAADPARAEASWTKLLKVDQESTLAAQAHLALAGLYRQAGRAEDAARETAAYERLKKPGNH